MTTQKPVRKDWTLFIFIIPIAVILILFVGQWAIRLVPFWSVNVSMTSNLEPDTGSARPFALLEPLLPQILIPLPWADTYLDPNGDVSFPSFLIFEPAASPSPTPGTPPATETTPTGTPVPSETPSPTSSATVAPTNGPGDGTPSPTEPTPGTCQDSNANNQGQPLPCTYPPAVCTDPAANNVGQPLPCTYPPTVCTDPAANNVGQPLPCTYPPICPGAHNPNGPLPCDYGTVSTPPVGVTQVSPDGSIGVDTPPNNTIGSIVDGSYIVLNISVTVSSVPDNFYDLVFYEWNNGGSVYMDLVIIGITNDGTGSTYYEVFNWGNGSPDMNSNVGEVAITAGGEDGDQAIIVSGNTDVPPSPDTLHDPDYDALNGTNGTMEQTGVLIDVDNADSDPPPGTYQFVVIISPPNTGPNDGGDAQIDSIQATEVPIPTP